MKIKIFSFFLISLLVSGCVTAPTQDEIGNYDYGDYPKDYKKIIESYLNNVLKDPDSKKIEYLNTPEKNWFKLSPLLGGVTKSGYVVCAYVNAKNGFGGYTGKNISYFMIYNQKVIQNFMATTSDSIESMQAEQGCKKYK